MKILGTLQSKTSVNSAQSNLHKMLDNSVKKNSVDSRQTKLDSENNLEYTIKQNLDKHTEDTKQDPHHRNIATGVMALDKEHLCTSLPV